MLIEPWPKDYREAVALQEKLRWLVKLTPLPRPPRLVAGVDAAYDREGKRLFGTAALYRYPELGLMEEATAEDSCPFPYIPGLLTFREAPILATVVNRLNCPPDVVLVDGQGIAHPRGLGLASHLGLLLDLPTVGVAKSRLVGEGPEPAPEAGALSPLWWEGRQVGVILRSKKGKKPLYLSPGYKITLEEAVEITLGCLSLFRIPVPLRQADLLSRRLRAAGRSRAG